MKENKFEELCENVSIDMLKDMVNECNSWNGSLDNYQVYDFDDDFFETFFSGNIIEAVRATYFGKIQNWFDDYIYFNAYGNLESMSDYAYDNMLEDNKEEIIKTALDLYQENCIYLDDEIIELFDEYLKEDNDNEDKEE